MVKKEVFEWIRTGQKSIELRRGKAKKGDEAVFQCGRSIIRGIIVKKEEGSLTDVFREDNYKKINPNASSLEDAIAHLKMLYEKIDGIFTAYTFKL
jgi:ASC-1-like (ASCH) protein